MERIRLPHNAHYIRLSPVAMSFRLLIAMFLLEMGFLFLLLILGLLANSVGSTAFDITLLILTIAKFLIQAVCSIYLFLEWANTVYYMTEHHLICYKGIFNLDENVYELHHLRSVDLHESLFGRLFGYGDVTVNIGASGYHHEICLRAVKQPKKYERFFRLYMGAETRQFLSAPEPVSLNKPETQ